MAHCSWHHPRKGVKGLRIRKALPLAAAERLSMKKFAFATLLSASFALAACGSSDSANEAASPDNVEMPAEEAVGGIDAAATPAADAAATETGAASDAATAAASTGATPTAAAATGVPAGDGSPPPAKK